MRLGTSTSLQKNYPPFIKPYIQKKENHILKYKSEKTDHLEMKKAFRIVVLVGFSLEDMQQPNYQ